MEERNISITLEKAQEWYNSGNESLREVALQAFNEEELKFNFRNIRSLEDACKVLDLNYREIVLTADNIEKISKVSAAMFKLNIIKKALNFGQELSFISFIKEPKFHYCYPFNPIVSMDSTYFDTEIEAGRIKIVGKCIVGNKIHWILGDSEITSLACFSGLGAYSPKTKVSLTPSNIGFLGCANEEIAKHFSLYFGVLITEAKYGDLKDFEIIRTF